jgi:hypothetical protein
MILLWGVPGDTPLAQVHSVLTRLGHPVAFVDQRAVLETELELTVDTAIRGIVRIRDRTINLDRITAVYLRPYGVDQLPVLQRVGRDSPTWSHAVAIVDALLAWIELTPALVVNRPSAMASNASKPYQARLIESLGFAIPETLITTDPDAVREFWAHHGTIVYKSISGVRSIVTRLTAAHLERLELVHYCPTQFQQYIPGNDYRVHVVGEEVFTCEITSMADDYRYATQYGGVAKLRPYPLPREVADRCRSLARALRLNVAGVDLRHHPAGQWYCFEVNPSPAFTYYQHATDHPIDVAIARLLIAGSSPVGRLAP